FIGYSSGVLGVISGTDIAHFNWVRESTGEATIRHIAFANGMWYLATPYRLVVFDVARHEGRETWRTLGENGTPLSLFQSAVRGSSTYLATDAGVLAGGRTDDLLPYPHWTRHCQNELAAPVVAVSAFDERIYAAVDGAGLFYCANNTWTSQ